MLLPFGRDPYIACTVLFISHPFGVINRGPLLRVPCLEFGDAGLADDDAVGGGNGKGECQLAYRPNGDFFDGPMGDNILAVSPEE